MAGTVAEPERRGRWQRIARRLVPVGIVAVLLLVAFAILVNVRGTPWGSRQFFFGGRGLDRGAEGSLAFAVDGTEEGGGLSVQVSDLAAREPGTVADGLAHPAQHAWSPDGRRLAYTARIGDERVLRVVPATGGDATDLVRTDASINQLSDLAWSPDGSELAFVADLDPEASFDGLWVVPAGGGAPRAVGVPPVATELCFDTPAGRRCDPDITGDAVETAWSPGGGLVYLSEIMPGEGPGTPSRQATRVVAVPAGGSPPSVVTEVEGPLDQLAVAPDGRHLLYGLSTADAHVWDTASGTARRLADRIGTPAWSADGERLLFANNRQVMVADADGSHVHRLTRTVRRSEDSMEGGSDLFDVIIPDVTAWSPDRRHVAFAGREGDGDSIYVMNADGTGQTRVLRTDGAVAALRWLPARG